MVNTAIFFWGLFGLVLAVGQIVRRRDSGNLLAFSVFGISGFNQLVALDFYFGNNPNPSATDATAMGFAVAGVHGLHVASVFALGPCLWGFLNHVLEHDHEPRRIQILHFAPSLLLLAMAPMLYGLDYHLQTSTGRGLLAHVALRLTYGGAALHVSVYCALAFRRAVLPLFNLRAFQREPGTILLAVFGSLVTFAVLVGFGAHLFQAHSPLLFQISAVITGVVYMLTFLLQQAAQDYTLLLRRANARALYAKTNLAGIDIDALQVGLERLMQDGEPFRDENLTLRSLGEQMDLTPHQLSELLNRHFDCTFAAFLNRYRVRAACRDLERHPERSILDIATDVGFRSKSNFNEAFMKSTGLTPTQYRRSLANPK